MENVVKPTESLLRDCIKACAEAHGIKFFDWSKNDLQMAVQGDSVPVVADMQMIVSSFYGSRSPLCVDFGYCNVFMDELPFQESLDLDNLRMALPNGKLDEILGWSKPTVEKSSVVSLEGKDNKTKAQEIYEKLSQALSESKGLKK